MTVITGSREDYQIPYTAEPKDRCTMCDDHLTLPYMAWRASHRMLFICGQCCEWIKHGFTSDLQGVVTARALFRMGFREGAQRAAVSGGLLYTTGTDNKQ